MPEKAQPIVPHAARIDQWNRPRGVCDGPAVGEQAHNVWPTCAQHAAHIGRRLCQGIVECFHKGIVGDCRLRLVAAASGDENAALACGQHQLLRQARLAHAWLASQQHEPARARHDGIEHLIEPGHFCVTRHERTLRTRAQESAHR